MNYEITQMLTAGPGMMAVFANKNKKEIDGRFYNMQPIVALALVTFDEGSQDVVGIVCTAEDGLFLAPSDDNFIGYNHDRMEGGGVPYWDKLALEHTAEAV